MFLEHKVLSMYQVLRNQNPVIEHDSVMVAASLRANYFWC